jgi:hypothetical protein
MSRGNANKGVRGRGRAKGKTSNPITTMSDDDLDNFSIQQDDDLQSAVYSLKDLFSSKLKKIKEEFNSQLANIEKAFGDTLSECSAKILSLESKVNKLENENESLKDRLDDMEQRQLSDTIIISGKSVKEALSAVPNDIPNFKKSTWACVKVLNDFGIKKDEYNILSATKIKSKPTANNVSRNESSSAIIVTLDDVISKRNIMSGIIGAKSNKLYVNESLTKKRRHLLKKLLEFRKTVKGVRMRVYSKNGNITVKHGDNLESVSVIRNNNDSDKIIAKLLQIEQNS